MRSYWLLVLCLACVPRDSKDVVDTGDTGDSGYPEICPAPAVPVVQFDHDLGDHPMPDGGDILFGTPPQGGAPYTPLQVRAKVDVDVSQRVDVVVDVFRTSDEERLAHVVQPQSFFCANTGVHEGWRYGGEVHARFTGWDLEALDEVNVRVEVLVDAPHGAAMASATGTLRWALGPGAARPLDGDEGGH